MHTTHPPAILSHFNFQEIDDIEDLEFELQQELVGLVRGKAGIQPDSRNETFFGVHTP